MHPATVAALEQLDDADWFSRVGVRDADVAIVLSSWQEALAHLASAEWKELRMRAACALSESVCDRSGEGLEKFDETMQELFPIVSPFVHSKLDRFVRVNNLPEIFEKVVFFDILYLCAEAEYADLVAPGFYTRNGYWYISGHLPCGWRGEYPEGNLLVY